MSLQLQNPQQTIDEIVSFLKQTYEATQKTTAVIAVSGGIDSALAVTLLARALGSGNVIPVMLPYGEQDATDAQEILSFNHIPQQNWQVIDVQPVVDTAAQASRITSNMQIRLGNLMARARMMMVYDLAKNHDALVCGTENKSEKYLGYFTRFGDEASDIEPIVGLYKTQVRQLAEFLNLPEQIRTKAPTAGLWEGQTDEAELGFSYEVADQVLHQLEAGVEIEGVEPELVKKVLERVEMMEFKNQVPYVIG